MIGRDIAFSVANDPLRLRKRLNQELTKRETIEPQDTSQGSQTADRPLRAAI